MTKKELCEKLREIAAFQDEYFRDEAFVESLNLPDTAEEYGKKIASEMIPVPQQPKAPAKTSVSIFASAEVKKQVEEDKARYTREYEQYQKDRADYPERLRLAQEQYAAEYVKKEEELDSILYDKYGSKWEEYEDVLHSDYWNDIPEIIKILEHGRADDLKEALNVFHSDGHYRKMEETENEKAYYAREQVEYARMQTEYARETAEYSQQQTEYSRKQAEYTKNTADRAAQQAGSRVEKPDYSICATCKRVGSCGRTPRGNFCAYHQR